MRILVNIAAALLAIAVALRPVALAGETMPYAALGGLAVIGFGLAIFTKDWVLAGPGVALLLAEYVIALHNVNGSADASAPVLAVACLLLLELVDLSLLLGEGTPQRKVLVRHGRYLVVVVGAGSVLAVTALAGGRVVGGAAIELLFVAAFAAVCAVAVAFAVARGSVEGPPNNP